MVSPLDGPSGLPQIPTDLPPLQSLVKVCNRNGYLLRIVVW